MNDNDLYNGFTQNGQTDWTGQNNAGRWEAERGYSAPIQPWESNDAYNTRVNSYEQNKSW